jgi:hypothetical protein
MIEMDFKFSLNTAQAQRVKVKLEYLHGVVHGLYSGMHTRRTDSFIGPVLTKKAYIFSYTTGFVVCVDMHREMSSEQ